jgi:hydrogenase maturation protein HypF
MADPALSERVRVRLGGAVQGVGMRPFVHRLATECSLAGFVRNGPDGVTIEVEGHGIDGFLARLSAETPTLASIDTIGIEPLPPNGVDGFAISDSTQGQSATRAVADAATCPDCLAELFDPTSRFFGYPFINCTQCGPRHTITGRLPYDRTNTAMAGFAMCPACAIDYADPTNRRFHAEPIACPACGPQLSHGVAEIAAVIGDGGIVALKGIGGFHLMCDARNPAAVATLRLRKSREAKPFAIMVADATAMAAVANPGAAEIALASTVARPIVLMAARPDALAPEISPGLRRIGVMLAYAPVHHLLFAALPTETALVATSANPAGEPLVVDNAEASSRLAGVADLIVTHDRPILIRADDSVAQILAGAPALLRRARGFVPDPIPLAEDGPVTLALGGQLKSTITVTRGREAFVSQHIGDLDTAETVRFWRETIAHLLGILDVRPERIACDLHPDYLSSRMAEEFDRPIVRVQHHAAHIAAIAGEHGITGPVLGLALDGHGLGTDGGAWGGEMIALDGPKWRRIGQLAPLPLPGGDRAAREPWRMGVAALHAIGRGSMAADRFPHRRLAGPLAARLANGAEPTATSSLGRLFDAAAALLGLRDIQAYEGQAAMELEALVSTPSAMPGGWTWDGAVLSFAPLLTAFADHAPDPRDGADLFHGTIIAGLTEMASAGAAATGITSICLGGGCLMNRVLAEGLAESLSARGLTAMLARILPPNDGGLSFGQAVLARRATTRGE